MKSSGTIRRRAPAAAAILAVTILTASPLHAQSVSSQIPDAVAETIAKIFRPNDVGDVVELIILASLILAVTRLVHSRNAALRSVHEMHSLVTQVEGQLKAQRAEMDEHNRELARTKAELAQANEHLTEIATVDGLTGISNRRAFQEQLDMQWQRYRRYATPVSLILIDLDDFAAYNDAFGHSGGDIVLEKVAKLLSSLIRQTDFVARFDGEEFVVLAPETEAEGATWLADRLRAGIEGAAWTQRPVTASFGVATSWTAVTADDLIESAAIALQRSKAAGQNRVTHWEAIGDEARV